MPTGTPYSSFVAPYDVRVDDFSDPTNLKTKPLLHLLSHTHSDHINGLSSKLFAQTVYCSPDAKEMLLRHEVYAERELKETGVRAQVIRTFQHLKVKPCTLSDGSVYYHNSRDLLKTLPLNTPTQIELSNNKFVTITLLDANHCPGAVMFLIEGPGGAVLHTGDFRAEPWWLESLKRNPFLQKYIATHDPGSNHDPVTGPIGSTLETIYLDTACMLGPTINMPTKDEATTGLVSLMKLYPKSTRFFINGWTWGYEDIYKAVARSFQCKIHVDRYKHNVYSSLKGDPFLRSIITRQEDSTRFHACERFDRCSYVKVKGRSSRTDDDSHVVYINPVTMGMRSWQNYISETTKMLQGGKEVSILLVPLSRHSPLPELQNFVSLFRPKRVVPNTLDPKLAGLDWAAMPGMFGNHLSTPEDLFRDEVRREISQQIPYNWSTVPMDLDDDGQDVALANLEGDGAHEAAEHWAISSKLHRKLENLVHYLQGKERSFVEGLLSRQGSDDMSRSSQTDVWASVSAQIPVAKPPSESEQDKRPPGGRANSAETRLAMSRLRASKRPSRYLPSQSDEETDPEDDEEARYRTAYFLLAKQAGLPSPTPDMIFPSSSPNRTFDSDMADPQTPTKQPLATKHVAARTLNASAAAAKAPVTPISPSDEPARARMSSASSPVSTNDPFHTPQRERQPTLRSPFVFQPSSPTSNRKRQSQNDESIPKADHTRRFNARDSLAKREFHSVPFVDLCNMSKTPTKPPTKPATTRQDCGVKKSETAALYEQEVSEMRSIKRRRVDVDVDQRVYVREEKRVHQEVPPPGSSTRVQGLPRSTRPKEDSGRGELTARLASSSRPASRPSGSQQPCESRRALRQGIARTLSKLPSGALEELRAGKTDRLSQLSVAALQRTNATAASILAPTKSSAQPVNSSTRLQTRPTRPSTSKFPSQLPDSDSQVEADVDMDPERVRELADAFRAEYAKGIRPGLVVPRLKCLESQSQSP